MFARHFKLSLFFYDALSNLLTTGCSFLSVALFHNNCMFLAHHLVTLGHQFRSKLPREIAERATFMDLVPQFRRLGIEIFVQQRIRLREQLMENLSEDNGSCRFHGNCRFYGHFQTRLGMTSIHVFHCDFCCDVCDFSAGFLSSEEDFSQTELSVRRVLHQLGQLARVWRGVLVTHLFHSAIGEQSSAPTLRMKSRATLVVIVRKKNVHCSEDVHSTRKSNNKVVWRPFASCFSVCAHCSNLCCGFTRFAAE